MIQDLLGLVHPSLRRTESWTANLTATAICVAGWGWFLYAGVVDPLGGINTMWPLFGIANQMLAAIALIFATVVLFRMKRERYAWVAMMPTAWLLVCTLTAGAQKLFDSNPRIGFLAHARKYSDALAQGKLIAPAGSLAQMRQVIVNDWIDASLCALLLAVVVAMVGFGIASIRRARRSDASIAREMMPVYQEIAHAH
jgi:carbon starvation protein